MHYGQGRKQLPRYAAALCLLLVAAVWALPAWAWPPTLEGFTDLARQAAPPGWTFSESDRWLRASDCAPQYVVIFAKNGDFLEYRLDLDNPEPENNQNGRHDKLEGWPVVYTQAGDPERFSYLTVQLNQEAASLTLGVSEDYSFEEMAALFHAFPLQTMLKRTQ